MKVINFISAGRKHIVIVDGVRNEFEAFKDALRKIINPKPRSHQHLETPPPPLHEMPDTTGDEIPAEALKFATFLKLDPPKKKSHPSRGNIH